MAGHPDKQKIATSVLQMILLKKSFTVFSHQNKVCSISSIRIFDQFRQEHYNNFPGFTPKPKVVKFLYFSKNGKIILLSFGSKYITSLVLALRISRCRHQTTPS